jgi:rare lipoprotein A (peptidoglycan hydrolase)
MKAKTKRRITHLVTKKKLVKKKTSRHFLRGFAILLATVSMGSLAYAITITKPVVNVTVHGPAAGQIVVAPSTPTPVAKTPGSPDQVGRGSWYALGLPAPDAITCASRTYARGSYLEVTDLYNGHKVVCLVNDYGPEIWTGRVVDMSRGAFSVVDNLGRGTIPVEIRLVTNTTSVKLPILPYKLGTIVGYSLCAQSHTSAFCDSNRQH